jgi:DNA-binding transcriptional ArsR family regulator
MSFTATAIKELKQELASLQTSRANVDARMKAIEILLSNNGAKPSTNGAKPISRVAPALPKSRVGSLRSIVLKELRQASPANTGDLTKRLETQGVRVGGVTSLHERISHELSRLRRDGIVRRDRKGGYMIRFAQSNGSATETPAGSVSA